MIWKRQASLPQLNAMGEGNMVGLLDIHFVSISDNAIEATMPVDHRTHQPFGLLHGGASVVLAETLGSVAGYLCTEGEQKWSARKSMPTIFVRCAAGGCEGFVPPCMLALAIRCGKSISPMSRGDCAAPHG